MKHKLIVVIGNVGSGKSTLCQALAEKLPAKLVPADELYKTNPFFSLTVGDRKRWSLTSDLWFLVERVKLAREAEEMLEKSDVVVDSGIPMSQVYAHSRLGHGYFTSDEWELYRECYGEFTKGLRQPDVVINLKADTKFLRKRIEKRGREFEVVNHSLEYLGGLEKSLEKVVGELKEVGVVVNEFEVEDKNHDELLDEVSEVKYVQS